LQQEPTPEQVTDSTPGERLLYALGQHYRRWRSGVEDAVPPHRIDIGAVARMRWVCAHIEYVQGGEHEEKGVVFLHLPSDVLVIDYRREFPWRLLSVEEWGERQEWGERLRREA